MFFEGPAESGVDGVRYFVVSQAIHDPRWRAGARGHPVIEAIAVGFSLM